MEPRAKSAHTFKPSVKKLDAKNDERFMYCDDGEKQFARLDIDSDIMDVKTDDQGGPPMTMDSIKARQGMLRASEVLNKIFTEP